MAEPKARSERSAHRTVALFADHRVNDVTVGHVGRISYHPVPDDGDDDENVGTLTFNRIDDQTHYFQEVSPREVWYPATQGSPLGDLPAEDQFKTPAIRRRQRIWLLNKIPDAFLGNTGIGLLLKEESALQVAPEELANPRLPLLAFGDIADLTSERRKVSEALAMAVGASAHMLRIVSLERRDRQWVEGGDRFLRLAGVGSSVEGHWCGEGTPLRQIKFIPYHTAHNTYRWLLVQTATTVILFDPEIHRVPVSTGEPCCSYAYQAPQCIMVKSILSLHASSATGNVLADVAFRGGPGPGPPQLATIDTCGNWSIWDILGNPHLREKNLTPRLTRRGCLETGLMNDSPLLDATAEERYRIWWLRSTRAGATTSSSDAPVPDFSDSEDASIKRPASSADQLQAGRLLICDGTRLKILDLQSGRDWTLALAKQDGSDMILDIQLSSRAPSQVFVLTSTTLFWLDTAFLNLEDERPLSGPSPAVLVSCPHLRRDGNRTMQLSIGTLADEPTGSGQIVSIYSSQSSEMTVFWMLTSSPGGPASVHHQLFSFSRPSEASAEAPRQRTMLLLPRHVMQDNGAVSPAADPSLGFLERGVRFFQAIALGTDLSLQSCLCATSRQQEDVAAPPFVRDTASRPAKRRKALLRYYGDSFVVPDTFDERAFVPQSLGPRKTTTAGQFTMYRPKPRTLRLSLVLDLAFELMGKRLRGVEDDDMLGVQEDPLAEVQHVVDAGFRKGGLQLQTLFGLAVGINSMLASSSFGSQWASTVEDLRSSIDENLVVSDLSRGSRDLDPVALHLDLVRIWSARVPVGLLEGDAIPYRDSLLAAMASILFLSQVGVEVVPTRLLEEEPGNVNNVNTDPLRRTVPAASPIIRSASGLSPSTNAETVVGPVQEQPPAEDMAVVRLGRYTTIGKPPPAPERGEHRIISHWVGESDPWEYQWAMPAKRNEAKEQLERKQLKQEAQRRARAERLGLPVPPDDEAGPASQPAPRIMHSSQFQPASSQHVMSQTVGGPYGARPKPLKKVKKTSGFR